MNPLSVISNTVSKILLDQRTSSDIERELNNHFDDWTHEIRTYNDESVTLGLESITVRPKYRPEKEANGIYRAEPWMGFSSLETDREKPTLTERINAIIKSEWVSILRFKIKGGDITDIRPEGLSLSYITIRTGLQEAGRQIREAETSEVQSDKLEMKIMYRGSIGEYKRDLSDAIDLLTHIQNDIDTYIIQYLLSLNYAVEVNDNEWAANDQARQLGEYLYGSPIDMDRFDTLLKEAREEITQQMRDTDSD